MRRAEVMNALRQEGRFRVSTPSGPGWVHGPLDDSGSVRVGFDDGTSGRVQIDDLERPRQPRPPNRGPEPRPLALLGMALMIWWLILVGAWSLWALYVELEERWRWRPRGPVALHAN